MSNDTNAELLRFWLLTAAVEFPASLTWIFPSTDCLQLNMPEVPFAGPAEVAAELRALEQEDLLCFETGGKESATVSSTDLARILHEIAAFSIQNPDKRLYRRLSKDRVDPNFHSRPDFYLLFELTPAGAQAWEQIAQPDWNRFSRQWIWMEERNGQNIWFGELASQNRDLLMALLGWERDSGHTPEDREEKPDLKTVKIELIDNYEAFYWKRLDRVYRATFQYEATAEPLWPVDSYPGNHDSSSSPWFSEWRHSLESWHRKPWQLPGWPAKVRASGRSGQLHWAREF